MPETFNFESLVEKNATISAFKLSGKTYSGRHLFNLGIFSTFKNKVKGKKQRDG